MDGYMLIKQIRAMPQAKAVRAIALTAFARETDQQKAIAAGFDLHISKPVEPLTLIQVIQQRINRRAIN